MWEINVGNQFATLAFSICLGFILCASYDILRALRKIGLNSFFAVFITDILFCVLSALVTFIFFMARTSGEIRGYVLITEVIGFALFRVTVSRFVLWFFTCFFQFVKKVIIYLNKGFEYLYLKTDSIILKTCRFIVKKLKTIKKLLKKGRKVLYTNKNNNDNAEYVLNETKT